MISPSLQNDSMWIQNSKTFTYSVNECEVVFLCGQEVLLVLDGTTGLNMLPQAREFNQVIGVTGFVLTKLDGTARGGCVVSIFSLTSHACQCLLLQS